MKIRDALDIAARWAHQSTQPMIGAFVGGSAAQASADTLISPGQDVDLYLVVPDSAPEGKIGKTEVDGVLLDISFLEEAALTAAIAADHAVLTSLLHFGRIVRDTDDALHTLQAQVRRDFREPDHITARTADMHARILAGLRQDSSALPYPEQVMNWLFPATLTTHLPLIQACVPLTVRKRFLAAKRVLPNATYEDLLACFGWQSVRADQATRWLEETAELFDASAALARSSGRFWAGDVLPEARVVAIQGSRELIEAGHHREALYWIIATSARCLVLHHDSGVNCELAEARFQRMLDSMGLALAADWQVVGTRLIAWMEPFLPDHS